MVIVPEELGLRLSYDAGVLDGITMMTHMLDSCECDCECKTALLDSMYGVARSLARTRGSLLLHLVTEP